jgi:hypothetical protein
VKTILVGVLTTFFCLVIIASGALQCFAPQKLKEIEDRLRPKGEWCASAGGTVLGRLREKQAAKPSVLYRLSGVALMTMGILMLAFVLGLLRRW